ncbi:MAG: phosphoribosylanthranilate isomerase [Paludibacter sp.]|nr:phosphoribosylanthranilate isomerase [Paludibacter sp.]
MENFSDKSDFNSPLGVRGLIKICGMKFPENIQAVAVLKPDFMGFIFYPKSPRFAEPLDIATLKALPKSIKKIGVFVNENLENILTIAYKYDLDGVQLHGTELVDMCTELKKVGYIVIKAFPIAEAYNFKVTKDYEGACDYFLFDTKTDAYGGSGLKFNWKMLDEYLGETPFLLSGGIAADDAEAILKIEHKKFAGIDLNSKFELKPGLKNIDLLKSFILELKN